MKNLLESIISQEFLLVNKILLKKLKINESIILSMLIDKRKQVRYNNELSGEWFYFRYKDIQDSVLIGKDELMSVVKSLKSKNIINVKKVGTPAKNYYLINDELILQWWEIPTTCSSEIQPKLSENPTTIGREILPPIYKNNNNNKNKKVISPKDYDSSVIVPEANRLTNSNYGTLVHPIKNHFKEILNKQSYLNGFRESYSCGKAELKAIDDYLKTELEELNEPDFDATLNKAKTLIDKFFFLLEKDEVTRQDKFFNPSLSTVLGGKRNQWILRYLELDKSTKTEKVKVIEQKPEQVKEPFEKRKSLFDNLLTQGVNDPTKRMKYFCENKQDFEILKHDISFSGSIIVGSDLHHAITEDEKYKAKISNKDIEDLSVIW